jgi:hypothetical protein
MPKVLIPAALLAALSLAACGKPAVKTVSTSDQAASSTAPVKWDMASNDPAKNPVAANKEGSAPGFNP